VGRPRGASWNLRHARRHKAQELAVVERRHPADHYVLIDDKP
jgi:hypothetical protein